MRLTEPPAVMQNLPDVLGELARFVERNLATPDHTPAAERACAHNIWPVFENYAQYPRKSAYDNICFGLGLHDTVTGEIDRRIVQTGGLLGLTAALNRKLEALSGGQQQRIAIGRALVGELADLVDWPLPNSARNCASGAQRKSYAFVSDRRAPL